MSTQAPIRRILCATDTSPGSQPAVDKATALAKHLDAELVLIYVSATAEDNRIISAIFATSREVKRLADEMLRADQATLDQLVERAREDGVKVRRHLAAGDPADEIVRAAEELDVGLVIAGTHGRTGLDRFLLGSVAERVIRTCPRPVMVARNPSHIPTGGYRKILVPTDFSEHAKAAFALACRLAATDVEIELLHCWTLPPGVGAGPKAVVDSISASIEAEVRGRGEKLKAELGPDGEHATFYGLQRPPAQGVSDRITSGGFDLVVMGSHGRDGLSRFILGSVAETTIHHAPCSVVTVPDLSERA